jgi:hypothetical protein
MAGKRQPIDNIDNIKQYDTQKINTATKQLNSDKLYPTRVANPFSAMMDAAEKVYEPNVLDTTKGYRAIVMAVYDTPSATSVDRILSDLFFLPWGDTRKTVIARIPELAHASLPMPSNFDEGDGDHQFFISMHHTFTSLEPIDVKVGDVVLVDFKDSKNLRDGTLLKVITASDIEGDESTKDKSKLPYSDIPIPKNQLQPQGVGYDPKQCGGAFLTYAPCKSERIAPPGAAFASPAASNWADQKPNGRFAKLHPTVFENFQKMVDAAWLEAKIAIGPGSTYRSEQSQKETRKANCKMNGCQSGDNELFYGPFSDACKITCKPSVAKVAKQGKKGGSRHMYGEAIDIYLYATNNTIAYPYSTGHALASPKVSEEEKRAIKWLINNSTRFNLYNFGGTTGEAWHYSTDGQ